jgi:hypothetical protein
MRATVTIDCGADDVAALSAADQNANSILPG